MFKIYYDRRNKTGDVQQNCVTKFNGDLAKLPAILHRMQQNGCYHIDVTHESGNQIHIIISL